MLLSSRSSELAVYCDCLQKSWAKCNAGALCVTFHLTFSINSLEAAATRPGQASSQRIFFRIFYRQISVSWGVCSTGTGSAVQWWSSCSGCAQNIQFSPPGNCPLSDNAMHDIPAGTRTSSHSNVSLEQKHGFEYFPAPCSGVKSVYQVPTLTMDPADI